MSDNVIVSSGTGNTIAADEVVDATLGTVKVQFMKIMDGTLDSSNKQTVNSDGSTNVKVTAAIPTGSNIIGNVGQNGTWTVQPGNTPNTTAWLTTSVPTTTGGLTAFKLISAATTNATAVKTSAGQLYNIQAFNNNASAARYLKLYNKASAPTVGTDTPVATYLIPAGGSGFVIEVSNGFQFATGIAIAITAVMTDADTTAIAASEVAVNIQYK